MEQTYHWEVIYKDEEVPFSQIDPEQKKEISFAEVDRERIKKFQFVGDKDGRTISVDLENGHFEVDGIKIHPGRDDLELLSGLRLPYKLIWAERHVITPIGQGSYYLLGWEVTYRKKKYKRLLYIFKNGDIAFSGTEEKV